MNAKKPKNFEDELLDDLLDQEGEGTVESNDSSLSDELLEQLDDEKTVKLSEVQLTEVDQVLDEPPQTSSYLEDKTHYSDAPMSKPTLSAYEASLSDATKKTGRAYSTPHRSSPGSVLEISLSEAEELRVVQERISQLEKEVEVRATETEQLLAACETLRSKNEELVSDKQNLVSQISNLQKTFEAENQLLKDSLNNKDKQISEQDLKIEEMESRLSTSVQKIRVRERELENRLEISKVENSALLRSKNETILDLKRKQDQDQFDMEKYRKKIKDLHKKLDERKDLLHKTIRTMRMTLSMLDGESGFSTDDKKKTGS